MKYNYKNYTEAENNFIKHKLEEYTYVKTLGSHSSVNINESNGWRQLIFIGFSSKSKKSTYIIFKNDFFNKTFDFRLNDFLNPSLVEGFISAYDLKKSDFDIKNHEMLSKIEKF